MKEIVIQNEFEITGRGTVCVVSMEENKLHITDINVGDTVIINNVVRKVRGIEMARNGHGNVVDTIGLLV